MHRLSSAGWWATAGAAVALLVLEPSRADSLAALTGRELPAALTAVMALATEALAAWILLIVAFMSLSPQGRVTQHIAPASLRLAMVRRAAVLGAVGALSVGSSHASADPFVASEPAAPALAGLQLPDRPQLNDKPGLPISVPDDEPTLVIVQPGDTLWGIAADHLEADATSAAIASSVQRWHHTNRHVIGDNPDLIHPEQHLTPPPKDHA